MDSIQSTLGSPSPSVTKFRQRPPPAWVPCSGTKRRASIANLGDGADSLDVCCMAPPAKQFAVDEEVAPDILRDGFYYDPAIPPPVPVNENQIPEEVEMGDDFPASDSNGVFVKGPGEISPFHSSSHESMSDIAIMDEKEWRDDSVITPHSMHDSQPISKIVSSKTKSSVLKSFSLILSNEIQETLTQKKQNEDFILPKYIMDQVSGSNTAMALVPWKPPMRMENLLLKELQPTPKEKVRKAKIGSPPQLRELIAKAGNQVPYLRLNESLVYFSTKQEAESESVEMDTSL